MNKIPQKLMSIIISLAMLFGMAPLTAMAADTPPPVTSGEITAFAELDESVANQSYENIEAMLSGWIEPPETLTVTVRLADDETATPATTGGDTVEADIPVVWDLASREETGNGGFINRFAPIIGDGFTLAEGVELPIVTVTVEDSPVPEIDPMAPRTTALNLAHGTSQSNAADGWAWDGVNDILTLSNMLLHVSSGTAALTLPGGSTIDLTAGTHNEVYINAISGGSTLKAIDCAGDLTIKGSGTLTINSANGAPSGYGPGAVGINSTNNVTIEGGTITVTGTSGSSDALTVFGIYAPGTFSITGGTVTARSSHRTFSQDYIVPAGFSYWKSTDTYTPGTTKYVSTGNNPTDKIDSTYKNVKIVAAPNYTLYYNDGDGKMYKDAGFTDQVTGVTGWSPNGTTLNLTGIDFTTSAADVLVVPDGTTINVTGTNKLESIYNGTASSSGILCSSASGSTLIVSGDGSLTVTSGKSTGSASYSEAIRADNFVIGGTATVTGNGGDSGHTSTGIAVGNDLTVSGGTVTGNGGAATTSRGVLVVGNFAVTDGTVYAKGTTDAMLLLGTVSGTLDIKGIDNNNQYTIKGQFNSAAYKTIVQSSDGTTPINDAQITKAGSPPPPPPPSGGGGSSTPTPAPKPNPWLEPNPAQTLSGDANNNIVRTSSDRIYGVRKDSWQKLKGRRFEHDTMDGNSVGVRLYIDNPEGMKRDMYVTGYVTGAFVEDRKARFKKFYKNELQVIHMDETAPWGQDVRLAAKLDLSKMDTKNLYFYSYDAETRTYKPIPSPSYRIDKNGYLHFTTPFAGDIIISDGPLERK